MVGQWGLTYSIAMAIKPHNNGLWTAARYSAFIKGGLRQISHRWPPKHAVKKAAWVERGVYQCVGYKKRTHKVKLTIKEKGKTVNNVFVDHINPVVCPAMGFAGWDEYIDRMFTEADGLQVLCKDCHKRKTADEREQRKQAR